jgi:hypothetical protein
MFDFRKSVRRHHSIDVPFRDEFSADRDLLLRDNNDILVTSAGVRIAGLNHSSSSQRPLVRLLMKVLPNAETPKA